MANRRLWWCSGFLAVVVLVGGTVAGVMLKHEPNFYHLTHVPPSKHREFLALKCASDFAQMGEDIKARREKWACNATETQIDSFLEEIFPQLPEAEKLRKLGIADPLITFDEDCIRVAFRYGAGWFSTVVSYDLQIWLVPKEANAVAIKVLRARAGALPISSHTVLHRLGDLAREQSIDMTLYRHEGKSVAILRLGDHFNPTWILTALKVAKSDKGPITLAIRGRTPEHVLPPPMIKAAQVDATH